MDSCQAKNILVEEIQDLHQKKKTYYAPGLGPLWMGQNSLPIIIPRPGTQSTVMDFASRPIVCLPSAPFYDQIVTK